MFDRFFWQNATLGKSGKTVSKQASVRGLLDRCEAVADLSPTLKGMYKKEIKKETKEWDRFKALKDHKKVKR